MPVNVHDPLRSAVAERLRFWEEELTQAALEDDDARIKVCDLLINEYVTLLDVANAAGGGRT